MGNLITETPYSEVTATLELLDRLGVDRDGLKKFRKASSHVHLEVAWLIQEGEEKDRSSILTLVSMVLVPRTTGKFVACEKFIRDTGRKAKVKIIYLGDNFTEWFLNNGGKIEDQTGEQTLRYHKLRKSLVDGPIIAELGGEAKAETTLTEMFSLMEKQANGEDGVLLNNGYANIFYIKDHAGVLRAVCVYWSGVGWGVSANSVGDPRRWDVGPQVFSRNSVLNPSATVSA